MYSFNCFSRVLRIFMSALAAASWVLIATQSAFCHVSLRRRSRRNALVGVAFVDEVGEQSCAPAMALRKSSLISATDIFGHSRKNHRCLKARRVRVRVFMVVRRLVFLLLASLGLIAGVTKFGVFVVNTDLGTKEVIVVKTLKTLKHVNITCLQGGIYFLSSVGVDKLTSRKVKWHRACFIGGLAVCTSLAFGGNVTLDGVEAATRYWFKPHVEIVKVRVVDTHRRYSV